MLWDRSNSEANVSMFTIIVVAGWNGFLGTRASLMMDVVFLAMWVIVPVMLWSIGQVKYRRRYERHARVQLSLGILLGVAITFFEIDVRIHGWRDRARASRFWVEGAWNDWIDASLIIHLCCAIPTTFLWLFVLVQARRRFPRPVQPNEYSSIHRKWARVTAMETILTAVTGWVFYYFAFVA